MALVVREQPGAPPHATTAVARLGGGGESGGEARADFAAATAATFPMPPPTITPSPITRIALDPSVLVDIDSFTSAFEVDNLRSLAAFRTLAQNFCIGDLHLTARAGRRVPPFRETANEYATLLFEAVVRRLCDRTRSFDARLCCLYLLLALHEQQLGVPRAPIPVLEGQWQGFERLAYELRQLRHADGFGALHALWAGGRLTHRAGTESSVNAADVHTELTAENEALRLPANVSAAKLDGCAYARRLAEALPAMRALEAQYAESLRAVSSSQTAQTAASSAGAAAARAPSRSQRPRQPPLPPPGVASALEADLDDYVSGRLGAAVTAAAAASGRAEVPGSSNSVREAMRHKPYVPSVRKSRDGGVDRSRKRARAATATGAAAASAP